MSYWTPELSKQPIHVSGTYDPTYGGSAKTMHNVWNNPFGWLLLPSLHCFCLWCASCLLCCCLCALLVAVDVLAVCFLGRCCCIVVFAFWTRFLWVVAFPKTLLWVDAVPEQHCLACLWQFQNWRCSVLHPSLDTFNRTYHRLPSTLPLEMGFTQGRPCLSRDRCIPCVPPT